MAIPPKTVRNREKAHKAQNRKGWKGWGIFLTAENAGRREATKRAEPSQWNREISRMAECTDKKGLSILIRNRDEDAKRPRRKKYLSTSKSINQVPDAQAESFR
ncbi:MAG: hypothetical protein ABSG04_02945, partial [Verrucomicrobiota bacterium]